MPVGELLHPALSMRGQTQNPPEPLFIDGTDVDTGVWAFDDTTEEFIVQDFNVHQDIEPSGTVTFRVKVSAKLAAASKKIAMRFGHHNVANGEDFDAAYTNVDSGDKLLTNDQDDINDFSWTATVASLGWITRQQIFFRLSRIAPTVDNLSGDLRLHHLTIEIPLTGDQGTHTHVKADITNLETITTTPAMASIPKSDDNSLIDAGWIQDLQDLSSGPAAIQQLLETDGLGGWVLKDSAGLEKNTVTTTDNTLTTIATIALGDNSVNTLMTNITTRRTDAGGRASYSRRALVFREAGGGATLEGIVDNAFTRESSGSFNATINVSSNDVLIQVQGANGQTLEWTSLHIINTVT